jgi:hypothetical protein
MVIHLLTLLLAQNMFGGLPIDGIRCDTMEGDVQHIHSQLRLTSAGRAVTIPENIGIPQGGQCLYWVHTHTADGLIHIEAPVKRTFTLGEFFDIWNQPLSRTKAASLRASPGRTLRITVNGKAWRGDPRTIPLRDHEEIAIANS